MIGWVRYADGREKTKWMTRTVGLLSVAEADLRGPWRPSKGRGRWQARKADRFFGRCGVRRIIVDDSVPYPEYFARWPKVEMLPFYRQIADLFALEYMTRKGILHYRGVVALSGGRLSPELRGAAERLCPLVRGIAIDVPEEGEWYAAWLHRQFGLPIRTAEDADVTVAFSPTERTGESVVSLHEGALSLCGLRVTAPELDLPEGWGAPFLAALWECGSLDRKSLRLEEAETP